MYSAQGRDEVRDRYRQQDCSDYFLVVNIRDGTSGVYGVWLAADPLHVYLVASRCSRQRSNDKGKFVYAAAYELIKGTWPSHSRAKPDHT